MKKLQLSSLCLFCLFSTALAAYMQEPWGRDAHIVNCKKEANRKCQKKHPNPLVKMGDILIRFHQEVISPIDGPRSHYRPSSSQYALDAIRTYGFFTGIALGCDRLLRENKEEWIYPTIQVDGMEMKWDPVDGSPPPKSN